MRGLLPKKGDNNLWYASNDADTVLVFVHGVLSDSRSCWLNDAAEDPAAWVFWPDLVSGDPSFRDPSIYLGGYYTALDAQDYDAAACAAELFGALKRSREGEPAPALAKQKIVFICHSTGGIVVRALLVSHPEAFLGKQVGLLLVASPSHGAELADALDWLAGFYGNDLVRQLRWGNDDLLTLHQSFKELVEGQGIPYLVGKEAYENHFVVSWKWFPIWKRRRVVSSESAGRYFGDPVLLRKTDHFSSVKPHGIKHPAHELLLDFLAASDLLPAPRRRRRQPGEERKALSPRPGEKTEEGQIWNVPFRRNPNFSGREQELGRLEAALDSGKPAALSQAIAGMGGVGKTQLAVEYAHRHRADYKLVWWLRCEEPATLKADYAALGGKVGLEPQQKLAAAVAQVKLWLEHHPGWLLIFDNAPEPKAVEPYLPRAETGRVLITSRNRNWGAVVKRFEVDLWSPEESVAFLEKRTGRSEPEAAANLAEELGRLPLALEQAAAYIVEKGQSLAGYLKLYRKHHLLVLEKGQPGDRYEGTVATTWNLALSEVEQASPAANQLMALCAYLAPEEIPVDVFQEGRKHLPEPLRGVVGDELALDEALGALLRYSMIERSGELLSVHRLVQEVVRKRLGGEAGNWTVAAVRVVEAAFPYDSEDVRFWPKCGQLLPHAIAALDWVAKHHPLVEAAELLNQIGLHFHGRAQFHEAKAYYERALAMYEVAPGPDQRGVAIAAHNLGVLLHDSGDLAGAKALYERAQAIDKAHYGPDHPTAAVGLNNLGRVLLDLEDFEGARAYLEQALAIDEAAYGSEHTQVATDLGSLGLVLKELGDLAGAKAHFERALAIDEAAYGSEHPEVATDLGSLGLVLEELGDLAGAKAHFERALAIDGTAYGPDHLDVARDLNNLGLVLNDGGDLEGAKAHFERALAIATALLRPDHSTTQTYRRNLEGLGRTS